MPQGVMLYIGGSKKAYRHDCGANVFTPVPFSKLPPELKDELAEDTAVYSCNGCDGWIFAEKDEEPTTEDILDRVNNVVETMVSNFTYYDRRGSEYLSLEMMEKGILNGLIKEDDIIKEFSKALKKRFDEIRAAK